MKKRIDDFRVIENKSVSQHYFIISLECPVQLQEIRPGQFVQVLADTSPTTYLRRPISVYDVDYQANTISLLIKAIGAGTRSIAEKKPGEYLNLIYPLGNSFTISSGEKALLVGGGVGIAPMLMLAKVLNTHGNEVDVLIGGRSGPDIIEPDRFLNYGKVLITTEDGAEGVKGLVTNHPAIAQNASEYSRIYTCGPDPMMKAVAGLARLQGIPCEVSLENLMACGIGACLCCIVETDEGNKTSCVDGPVFDALHIKAWN